MHENGKWPPSIRSQSSLGVTNDNSTTHFAQGFTNRSDSESNFLMLPFCYRSRSQAEPGNEQFVSVVGLDTMLSLNNPFSIFLIPPPLSNQQ